MILFKGGNGLTKEEAVKILGAKDETEGVDAEYNWLEENYGKQNINWVLNDQELIDEGDRQFDLLKIKFPDGKMKEVWFDITEFYGK
jgi:hypothetical protein